MSQNYSKTINNQEDPSKIIQEEMRKKFGSDPTTPDNTIFIKEVTQYEIDGDNKYIVYLDYDYCVDYRENGNWPKNGHDKIYHKLKLLENLPDNHFSKDQRLSFRRQLAEALVAQYDGKSDIANLLLNTAKSFYDDSLRHWIFSWHCGIATLYFFIGAFLLFVVDIIKQNLYDLSYLYPLGEIYISSLFGAYISFVIKGWRKNGYVFSSTQYLWLYPFLRMIYGICSGYVIYIFVSCSTICPKILCELVRSSYGINCIMLLAGYADFLVPKWLDSFARICKMTLDNLAPHDIETKDTKCKEQP